MTYPQTRKVYGGPGIENVLKKEKKSHASSYSRWL